DVIVGAILRRRSVVGAAGGFEQLIEYAVLRVGGSHEHQMLEQMGESGASCLLSRGTDVIPDVHRQQRDGMVLMKDDVQTVRQCELCISNLELRLLPAQRWGAGQQEHGQEQPSHFHLVLARTKSSDYQITKFPGSQIP